MTRDDRGWLTDDFPELRDAPPWVMEEMILAQPQLAAPILGADRPEVTRLRDAAVEAAAAGEPVVVTGCGTSEHAAMVVAELLTRLLPSRRLRSSSGRGAPGTRRRPRPARGRHLHRHLSRRRDQSDRARARGRPRERSHDRTDHGLHRSLVLVRRGPRLRHSRPRRLLVPHAGLHERHPGRGTDLRHRRRRRCGRGRGSYGVDLESPRRPRGGRGAFESLRPRHHRRPGPRPGERR